MRALAQQYDCSIQTVDRCVHGTWSSAAPQLRGVLKLAKHAARIHQMYASGIRLSEIMRVFKSSETAVRNVLIKMPAGGGRVCPRPTQATRGNVGTELQ